MQINDDDIRAAFAWPVRYDKESECVHDFLSEPIIRVVSWSRAKRLATGEVIAAMLNERFAPKQYRSAEYRAEKNQYAICANCGRIWLRHYLGDGSCPDDTDDNGWHPKNRFAPQGSVTITDCVSVDCPQKKGSE